MAAAAARAASIRIEKESPVEKRTYLSEVLARRPRATRRSNSAQPLNLLPYGALSQAKSAGKDGEAKAWKQSRDGRASEPRTSWAKRKRARRRRCSTGSPR